MSVKDVASTGIGRHLGMPKSRAASSDGSGDAAQEPDAGKSTGDEGWDCGL
jgi:phage terminase small subunit